MYRYELLKMRSSLTFRDLYGILGREERDGVWAAVAVAAPFSDDLEAVAKLAERCTDQQVSPEKLIDVVSDFVF